MNRLTARILDGHVFNTLKYLEFKCTEYSLDSSQVVIGIITAEKSVCFLA